MMTPPVHFRGTVLGPSGLAAEGREWLAALEAAGLSPSLEGSRLGHVDCVLGDHERTLLERCARRERRSGGITFHQTPIAHFVPDPRADVNALFATFETEGLPRSLAGHVARADLVLVRTPWAREVLVAAGVPHNRLHVVPPPFDTSCFAPRRILREPGAPFRWLSVSDWSLRKGYDVLLVAFARTFRAGEAELVLKIGAHGRAVTEAIREECGRVVRRNAVGVPPRVVVDDAVLTGTQIAGTYASCDAFVLPSRGEAWGRPVHEAMLMELPVVATAVTALQCLLPDDAVGYRVQARPAPVSAAAAAAHPGYRGQTWWEPDVASLGQRMREVFEDREGARRRGRAARSHVLDLCDRSEIADTLAELVAASTLRQEAAQQLRQ